jgi:hypothetical protein
MTTTGLIGKNAILDTIDKWIVRDVRPVVKKFDHAHECPMAIIEQISLA